MSDEFWHATWSAWGCDAADAKQGAAQLVQQANLLAAGEALQLAQLSEGDTWAPWAAMRRAVCCEPAAGLEGGAEGMQYKPLWREAEYDAALLAYHYSGDPRCLKALE